MHSKPSTQPHSLAPESAMHTNVSSGGGLRYPPFPGFPPLPVMEVPGTGVAANNSKNTNLNASQLNWSEATNGTTDRYGFSQSRDAGCASLPFASGSTMRLTSPRSGLEGSHYVQMPPPIASDLAGRTLDASYAAPAYMRRLDNSLSFSVPVPNPPFAMQQWSSLHPPQPYYLPSNPLIETEKGGASRLFADVPPSSVLVRMVNSAGQVVLCMAPESFAPTNAAGTAAVPPETTPPPPQPPQQAHVSQSSTPLAAAPLPPTSPLLSGPPAPAATTSPTPPSWHGHTPSSTASALGAVSPDQTVTCDRQSTTGDASAEEYEYEPYNANTLANRKVGSLDRVRCNLHGKERSAQNMVMVRSKTTQEVHWRCKHSSQCKVRTADLTETLLGSEENTLRSTAIEGLLSPRSDQMMSATANSIPMNSFGAWAFPPPPPQYTLISPTNAPLPMDMASQPHHPLYNQQPDFASSTSQIMMCPPVPTHVQPPPAISNSSIPQYPMYPPVHPPQLSAPPPPPPQGDVISFNGVSYRIINFETPSAQLR